MMPFVSFSELSVLSLSAVLAFAEECVEAVVLYRILCALLAYS